jgi:phosphatidate cytidylyltransferase
VTIFNDSRMVVLLEVMVAILVIATVTGHLMRRWARSDSARATADNIVARTRGWWMMVGVFLAAGLIGVGASAILFALISFLALREMITLSPTRHADHLTLFTAFFIVTPLQYVFVYGRWYGLFAIFIPVYVFLWVCIRSTLSGDYKHYMERVAKIYFALMICVYCVSHAPALLDLNIPVLKNQNVKLLFFLAIVVESSDVLQYIWGKLLGRRQIAPHISPNKTVEGFVGGTLSAVAAGTLLWWMTPFTLWQAALMALVIVLMGFGGGIVMSAVKRDAGVKDYGQLIPGHGGIMDRIDSLCFAAPVFFHLTRYYFAVR